MKASRVYRYEARLKLLYAGLVFESMELEKIDFRERVANGEELDEQGLHKCIGMGYFHWLELISYFVDDYVAEAFKEHGLNMKTAKFAPKVTLTNDYLRRLTKEFLSAAANVRKCENCGGVSPAIRKESSSKLFQQPLSRKDQIYMESKGMQVAGIMGSDNPQNRVSMQIDDPDNQDKKVKAIFLTPIQVLENCKHLWKQEYGILDLLFGSIKTSKSGKVSRKSSYIQFFMDSVAVPPTRFRPISTLGDKQFDHAQNQYLGEIIKANNLIVELRSQKMEGQQQDEAVSFQRIINSWVQMQESVNNLHDSTKNPKNKKMPPGIKQIMEKKEGLFRKHMMGKRVNYAARSVISPDPMIETSEIGIPMVFAKKLTYPEPVTTYNVQELRQAVINGPDMYPGAVSVQHEDGTISMLAPHTKEQRVAIANQLLTPASNLYPGEDTAFVNKKVHRHLKNGDMLLLNRQPTLHKPSIMGHIARILPGEKTIRMHYANCNTYNADFDGDEMNVHFPQNPIAQAEARLIANTNNQYLVPTSGEPLRGLIQDHVVTGVMMSSRNTFLTKSEYTQLVYGALPETNERIITIPPAIIKPRPLWTGKQVISTVLQNLTRGKKQLNLDSKSQVPGKSWSVLQAVDTEEGQVIVRDGELLTGILDKKQFGAKAYGLVHACYEVYGPDTAGQLLTALGRLFTRYVQTIGFTCRMDDLVVKVLFFVNDFGFFSVMKFIGCQCLETFTGTHRAVCQVHFEPSCVSRAHH